MERDALRSTTGPGSSLALVWFRLINALSVAAAGAVIVWAVVVSATMSLRVVAVVLGIAVGFVTIRRLFWNRDEISRYHGLVTRSRREKRDADLRSPRTPGF